MIDWFLNPRINKILLPIARRLNAWGVRANQVTIVGFFIGVCALPLISFQHYRWALVLILLNRFMDGLDGVISRLHPRSNVQQSRGAFLDISLDMFFYALVPLGFALARPENALSASVLLASFVTTATSFLSVSLLAQIVGLKSVQYPNKGIYFVTGLAEGFETIVFFVLICLMPNYFPLFAYVFAAICFLTAFLRIYFGFTGFSSKVDS